MQRNPCALLPVKLCWSALISLFKPLKTQPLFTESILRLSRFAAMRVTYQNIQAQFFVCLFSGQMAISWKRLQNVCAHDKTTCHKRKSRIMVFSYTKYSSPKTPHYSSQRINIRTKYKKYFLAPRRCAKNKLKFKKQTENLREGPTKQTNKAFTTSAKPQTNERKSKKTKPQKAQKSFKNIKRKMKRKKIPIIGEILKLW